MKIIQHKGRQLKRLLKDEEVLKEKIYKLRKEYEAEIFKIDRERDIEWSKVHEDYMTKKAPLDREVADVILRLHKLKKEILELGQYGELLAVKEG